MLRYIDGFLCEDTLGSGISASVYRARDSSGDICAVKVFYYDDAKNPQSIQNYEQELQAYRMLDHHNIVKMLSTNADTLEVHGSRELRIAYIALELVSGGSLQEYVELGAFSERICRTLFKSILKAVNHVHMQGLAHRDLKLDNILLDEEFTVKLADFGFTIPVNEAGRMNSCQGSEHYMAPELFHLTAYSGVCVDMFALGVVLYCLRAG